MPLQLVTGPANSGKAGRVMRDVRARLAEEPVLVVPAARDVRRVRLELADRGAVFGARVLRFDGLFEEVATRAGAGWPQLASDLQRELAMQAAVRRDPLPALARSTERPGFRRAALDLVAELERGGVEPHELEQALASWAGRGPRRAHARDVAALYSAYRAELRAAGLIDRELRARQALDALRTAPQSFGATPVFVHGFDDFTELELDLIETLAGRAGTRVMVTLPYEAGREAFKAGARVAEHLARLASEHERLDASHAHYAPGSRTALHRLERGLWAEPGTPADPGPALVLHRAGGERAEVELVGARVLELLRAGTPPGDVAVVFRDPARYESLVEQVFDSYGIPWETERRVAFGHTVVGRGLLALGAAAEPDGSADDLLAYLRVPGRLSNREFADELELKVRQSGIGSAASAAALWSERHGEIEALERLRAADDLPAWVSALSKELDRGWTTAYRRSARVLAATEQVDAHAAVAGRKALAELETIARGAGLDRARVLELLAELPVPLGESHDGDRVRLASPEQVRARRFQAVFVCGLQEGEFPRTLATEPFLTDEDRRGIAERGGLRLAPREDQLDRERYLFYVCASRAERLLVLSSRVSDEAGNPTPSSFFLEDVRELFGPRLEDAAISRGLGEIIWTPELAPTEVERERSRAASGPDVPHAGPDGVAELEVLDWLAERNPFSAAALETFTACPVKWLVERKLRPEALEPDPEQLVRGSLAHDALERTYRRLKAATGSARVTRENLAQAERILLEAVEEARGHHRISPNRVRVQAQVRRLQLDLLRHLRREAAVDTSFEPAYLELEFGGATEDGGLPVLELDGVRLRGRIDRVDTCGSHAIVRDYKTGKKGYPVARWEEDGRLQAAVYMIAVRELMGLEPAAGLYAPLAGDTVPRGVWRGDLEEEIGRGLHAKDKRDSGQVDEQLDAVSRIVHDAVDRIRAGQIRPSPKNCRWRGGCSHPAICRL